MRIGIISDTHGHLHPRVAELFAGVDHIIHAGDIGDEQILAALESLAPLTAVAGNIDDFHCGSAGVEARVELEGLRFYVTHIIDRPRKMAGTVLSALRREPADVLIFGHSHLPHNEKIDDLWFFNPASAGPRRFNYPESVGFFEKKGSAPWRAWHEPLNERSAEALVEHMNQL